MGCMGSRNGSIYGRILTQSKTKNPAALKNSHCNRMQICRLAGGIEFCRFIPAKS